MFGVDLFGRVRLAVPSQGLSQPKHLGALVAIQALLAELR